MLSQILTSITNNFSWAKVAYSVLLVGGIALLVTELTYVWLDTKLHIGAFQFYETGDEKPAQSKAFALQVLNHHRSLTHLLSLQAEQRRSVVHIVSARSDHPIEALPGVIEKGAPIEEKTWWPHEVVPIAEPKSTLSEIELSVQGINVKQIVTTLRRWVSTPNEVYGSIEKHDNLFSGLVMWPKGPSRAKGAYVDGQLLEIEGQADASTAAFHVACSLIWAQASISQPDLAYTPRKDFCNWAQAWSTYIALRGKAGSLMGLEKPDLETLKQLRMFLSHMIERGASYQEIYRLRADLVDLLPSAYKTDDDLTSAQNDRIYYAINTDPVKRKLPSDIAKLLTLADARPAIPLSNGALAETTSATWKSVLYPHTDNIAAAARATGFGRVYRKGHGSKDISFSGFAIAPNVIATVGFALFELQPFREGSFPRPLDDDITAYFSFGDSVGSARPADASDIDEVLYFAEGAKHATSLALLKLKVHDTSKNAPLPLDLSGNAPTSLTGRYVMTVGYPFYDERVPSGFIDALLGKDAPATKRLMPGRVVQVSEPDSETRIQIITSDLSTLGGTAGGPLVDLRTGMVVGLHYGGEWSDAGKFAYASTLVDFMAREGFPRSVREFIRNWRPVPK